MENNQIPNLVVFEKPALQDQLIVAAVGAIATIVVTAALSAGATAIQNKLAKRLNKKSEPESVEAPAEQD